MLKIVIIAICFCVVAFATDSTPAPTVPTTAPGTGTTGPHLGKINFLSG